MFDSGASNLAPGDTNGRRDVFLRDLETGKTERVSVADDGSQGNGFSGYCDVSGDGRYVLFFSQASNLTADDNAGVSDIFVRDRVDGTTELASVASYGPNPYGYAPENAVISADGRYVAFNSEAANYVPNDVNGKKDVFVFDRQTRETRMASMDEFGQQLDVFSHAYVKISADGQRVAWEATDRKFGGGDSYIFAKDLQTGEFWQCNIGDEAYSTRLSDISGDGRYVAFTSGGPVPGIWVYDLETETRELVSVGLGGSESDGYSTWPNLSYDGQYVAFVSDATNLAPGDPAHPGEYHLHIRDRSTGTTERVDGAHDDVNWYLHPQIDAAGQNIAFTSRATDIIPDDTNGWVDVFVYHRGTGPGYPRVLGHNPNGTIVAPASTLDVEFSEAIDPSSFDPAEDVAFSGPASPITITGHSWTTEMSVRLQFDSQTTMGQRKGPSLSATTS